MFYLCNKQTSAYFIYNPKLSKFRRESYDVAYWTSHALGHEVIYLSNKTEVDSYRKILDKMSYEDLTKMSKNDIISYLHEYYPEVLI